MRAAIRASYAANMAREDCPKCGGTGWKIVEGDMELPPTLARGTEQRRGGSAAAARVAVACECVVNERATRSLERARIPSRYEHCTFESFETDYFEGPQAAAFNASLAQAKLLAEGYCAGLSAHKRRRSAFDRPCGAGNSPRNRGNERASRPRPRGALLRLSRTPERNSGELQLRKLRVRNVRPRSRT